MIKKIQQFIDDVKLEMGKVSWPSHNELVSSTTIVVVVSIIFTLFIFFSDLIISIPPVMEFKSFQNLSIDFRITITIFLFRKCFLLLRKKTERIKKRRVTIAWNTISPTRKDSTLMRMPGPRFIRIMNKKVIKRPTAI